MSVKEINPSSRNHKSYESNYYPSLFEFSRDLEHSMQRSSLSGSAPIHSIFIAPQSCCTDSAIGFYHQAKVPD
jgi:hypothetical protein